MTLSEGQTNDINDSIGEPEKSSVLISLNQEQNFVWVYIAMVPIVICMWIENDIQVYQIDISFFIKLWKIFFTKR